MNKKNSLEQQFLQGKEPKNLEGFYKGTLELFIPGTLLESIGGLIMRFWVPWYGKQFDQVQNYNYVSALLPPLISLLFGSNSILGKSQGRLHAFPFKDKNKKSLKDKIPVLELDYDVSQNPSKVRQVVDEIVEIDKNVYLGKAYMKEKGNLRLLAYFRLKK